MELREDDAARDRVLMADGMVEVVDPREARHLLLKKIFETHCLIDVRLDGDPSAYQSAVIELLPDKGYLVIDALTPASGDALATRLPGLRLRTRVQGMEVKFTSRILARGSQHGLPYYKVRYPDEIEYPQRRRELRFTVPLNRGVPVRFETRGGGWVRGEIRDLSPGGFSARLLSGDIATIRHDGGRPTACEIDLPGHGTLHAAVDVRHILPSRARSAPRVGACFIELDVDGERQLQHCVAELARLRRRGV
ncbi:MAG: flagellar brake protein [Proteobacteria bacterium]|jgi:c-di-GMP-binding flagellar brake protein YcgR|nr:flagellar brake protein [Pseudomonadota bacterium]MBK8960085.1 flagellar brake protein [Pseudomonadota bacterium]